jgi:hypothetical protein
MYTEKLLFLSLIFFTIFTITGNNNMLHSQENNNTDGEAHPVYPQQGITITHISVEIRKKNQDGLGFTPEAVYLPHSTEVSVIAEIGNEFLIEFKGGYQCFVPKEKIITGTENIEDYRQRRLLSTFSEGPRDGYSWHQRSITYKGFGSVTKELLCSTIWQPHSNGFFVLVFFMDDIFKYGALDSGERIKGRYRIEDNKVILYAMEEYYLTHETEKYLIEQKEVVLELKKVNTLFSTDALVDIKNPKIIFCAGGAEPKAGDKVIVQEKECVYIHERSTIKHDTYPYVHIGGEQEKKDSSDESLLMKKDSGVLLYASYLHGGTVWYYCKYEYESSDETYANIRFVWIPETDVVRE